MANAEPLARVLVQYGFANQVLDEWSSEGTAVLSTGHSVSLLQVYDTGPREMVCIVSPLRIDVPVTPGLYRKVSEWNIRVPMGAMTMLGDDETALLLFHTIFPHEVVSSASPGSLQEYGWDLLRLVINAPIDFAEPEFPYSTADMGGRLAGEDDVVTLLMAAG